MSNCSNKNVKVNRNKQLTDDCKHKVSVFESFQWLELFSIQKNNFFSEFKLVLTRGKIAMYDDSYYVEYFMIRQ